MGSWRVVGLCFVAILAGCRDLQRRRAEEPVRMVGVRVDGGRAVERPDELAGVWEAPDGRGGAVGLQLVLTTTIPADRTTLKGAVQSWSSLEAGLYERSGPTVAFGDENWFMDSPQGGGLRYEDGRLRLGGPGFDLDLKRGRGDTWVGRFRRRAFDAAVTLRRPTMTAAGGWYLGTWVTGDRTAQRCLHLGRGVGGALVAWSDSLSELGSMQYGAAVRRAETAREVYGSVVKARAETSGEVSVEFGADSGWCCSLVVQGFRGRGDTMRVTWESQPNHVAGSEVWRRVAGESCVVGQAERFGAASR